MSGMIKPKNYDWKDSNLALFGSDTERQVKKEAAEQEPAWKMAGKKPGLQIWRINKFKVVTWPKDTYGSFYDGDSYIILNTYKEKDSDKLLFDVHFWIGKHSTQDEYGTAAYKTVELDTLLDDVPVQHREVMGYESSLFKSYFENIVYLSGGADSGFNKVEPTKYAPRLFRVSNATKPIEAKQVRVKKDQITSDDVFLLDDGLKFYQFNGKNSQMQERYRAAQVLQAIKRPLSDIETVDEAEGDCEEFLEAVDRADKAVDDDEEDDFFEKQSNNNHPRRPTKLYRLSDASGRLQFNLAKEGNIVGKDFQSKDVFVLHTQSELFVWVGKNTSAGEKLNAMGYAHNYLSTSDTPFISVTCLKEGMESKSFKFAIAA